MAWLTRRRGSGSAPDPLSEDGLGALTLLAVLEEAVTLLDAAESLLERCALAWDPGSGEQAPALRLGVAEARQGLRLRVAFTQLSRWLDGMVCEPEHDGLRADTSRLLRFYLLMISSVLDTAFAAPSCQHIPVRSGHSSSACRLIELRDLVRAVVE